jgi:hypothetical protein
MNATPSTPWCRPVRRHAALLDSESVAGNALTIFQNSPVNRNFFPDARLPSSDWRLVNHAEHLGLQRAAGFHR